MGKHKFETLTSDSLMPYGKYKNKQMIDVPASYLLYLYDNNNMREGNVKDYVINNLKTLKQEKMNEELELLISKIEDSKDYNEIDNFINQLDEARKRLDYRCKTLYRNEEYQADNL